MTPFSYDPEELKRSLIEYVKSKPDFQDFNYEGSALNTIIDTLVRNTHYIALMANMVASESFLDSAQLRANVVSHAQKLSYIPRSRTASTAVLDLVVNPISPPGQFEFNIIAEKGMPFIGTVDNYQYQFVLTNDTVLTRTIQNQFIARDVEVKQGQLISQRFSYKRDNGKIEISNKDIDSSTLRVFIRSSLTDTNIIEFNRVDNITNIDSDSRVFYLSENTLGYYDIEFGKDVLGFEPEDGSVVEVEYIIVDDEHGNGIKELSAASSISGYSAIDVTVKVEGYGGSERPDIETIKFIAPKIYEAQNRAVRESDYVAILIRDFPFIESANAWGGEKNIPPYYGKVFISAIPQEGFTIADTVKGDIEKRLEEYSMMGVELVDPYYMGLNLNIGVIFDANSTSDTFSQVSTKIRDIVQDYSKSIRSFGSWYNNSELINRIKNDIASVRSLEIKKTIFSELLIRQGINTRYEINFLNSLKPETLKTSDLILDINSSHQEIVDDGEGNVIKRVTKNGVVTEDIIGEIDYESGSVSFVAMFLNEYPVNVMVEPSTNNVYSERNTVVYIDTIDINRIIRD